MGTRTQLAEGALFRSEGKRAQGNLWQGPSRRDQRLHSWLLTQRQGSVTLCTIASVLCSVSEMCRRALVLSFSKWFLSPNHVPGSVGTPGPA